MIVDQIQDVIMMTDMIIVMVPNMMDQVMQVIVVMDKQELGIIVIYLHMVGRIVMVQVGKEIFCERNFFFLMFLFYRPYDRHIGIPPVDPYYTAGLPPEPPPAVDPYNNYDSYQKYYASRPRDPEFPGQRFAINFCFFHKRRYSFSILVIMIFIQIIVMIHME
jgi:hypothetical protein